MIWKIGKTFQEKKILIQINIMKSNSQNSPIFLGRKIKHFLGEKKFTYGQKDFFSYENLKERVQPWPSRHTEQFFHFQSYLEERIFTHIPHLGLYKSLPHPTKDDA